MVDFRKAFKVLECTHTDNEPRLVTISCCFSRGIVTLEEHEKSSAEVEYG